MNRKPDTIRAIMLIFMVGLIITGFTSLRAPEDGMSAAASAYVSKTPSTSGIRN